MATAAAATLITEALSRLLGIVCRAAEARVSGSCCVADGSRDIVGALPILVIGCPVGVRRRVASIVWSAAHLKSSTGLIMWYKAVVGMRTPSTGRVIWDVAIVNCQTVIAANTRPNSMDSSSHGTPRGRIGQCGRIRFIKVKL